MKISVITVFPDLYKPFFNTSLLKRASERGIISYEVDALNSFAAPKERIDAPIFGHGSGMLIKPEIVQRAIEAKEAQKGPAFKVFFSPQGELITQRVLERLIHDIKKTGHLMLLPARYEGMDTRVEEHYADAVLSVGDYVLMGGDLPAMTLLEGLLRLVPEVVGKQESVHTESFSGPFVDFPTYTEPVEWMGHKVPDIIRSGNHQAVDNWRKQKAAENTVYHHFQWLRSHIEEQSDKKIVRDIIPNHYTALMHSDVLIGNERVPGCTSVTSLDIHDIARSARTYNIEHYFIVTPLIDQKKIVQKLLHFWHEGPGLPYNPSRYEAVKHVSVLDNFQQVCAEIEKKEGKAPLVIVTSALKSTHKKGISFYDQEEVWKHKRPVLLVFGTGRGLTEEFVAKADYLLMPIEGFADFNHLSVRSAAAIIFDRWLGINKKI